MGSKLENVSGRIVFVRLNSQQTMYLEPKATTGEILETEISPKILRLINRGVLKMHKVEKKKQTSMIPKKKKEKSDNLFSSKEEKSDKNLTSITEP